MFIILSCQVPRVDLQALPVSIVEGLELRRHVEEVVGGVLLHVVDEPRVWGQVALSRKVDQGKALCEAVNHLCEIVCPS